jgi:hypothetical protein
MILSEGNACDETERAVLLKLIRLRGACAMVCLQKKVELFLSKGELL